MVIWPAIIKYDGDSELAFINSQADWEADAHWHHFGYKEKDALIDSAGNVYSLLNRVEGLTMPEPTGIQLSLQDMINLVQAHASQLGSCCVSKFSAASIQDAIRAIENL